MHRIFVSIIFIVLQTHVFAQDSYFGVKGGYGISKLMGNGESPVNLSPSPSFNIAMVFKTRLVSPFYFSLEPGYTRKGTDFDQDTVDYKFHYLNTPLLVDFYPIDQFHMTVGIEPGYLIGARNHVNDTLKQDISNIYNQKWDAALNLGAGISVSYFMDIGFRYSRSLTTISKQDAIIEKRNLRNQFMQFYVLFKVAN